MKWILPALLLLVLALVPMISSANAAQAFQPVYDLVSISNSSPGAHGDVVQHIGVPATDHVIGSLKYTLPAGWDIANVQSGDDSPVVGTGLLRIDVDQSGGGGPPCDGVMESYSLTIVDQGSFLHDPADVETNWAVQGYPFQAFPFTVKNISGTQRIESVLFQNPPNVCAMTTLDLTFQGVSSDNPFTSEGEAGRNVLTNPSSSGVYTWSVEFKSKPLTEPGAHTATRCDQIGIGGSAVMDTDGDGIANTCDNCPTTANANQLNWDGDSAGDACDPDVDGDGVANAGDQCPFTPLGQPVDVNGCSQSQVDRDLDGICDPGKSSPTLCTGSDNCPMVSNSDQANVVHPATPEGDACEDPDMDFRMDSQDNCPDIYNPFQLDGDLDGLGNECDPCPANPDCDADNVSDGPADPDGAGPIAAGPDNCLHWYNPAQNLPPWQVPPNDLDCDGFSAAVETSVGTSPTAHCGLDAWPADINNDTVSDITDIITLGASFGKSVPPAPARHNIAPDPLDGVVDISDIARLGAFFGKGCL
jgi:hypothetical protein